ncbi:thiamine pyrophosphate-dependent dehydrogenase E1 component subunit alpha [Neobacillus sp.]|uniref:thiamine pyrophosphate-dependent dehydrogenase E1 component subunit alpha n=1 Tax=Neobacillus sp. TaxID=2675273 RepID=UPI0028989B1C|nr:thiamine pyrophosphate-dependent dehydrogenase E1 component subunit alpha [Neobacillus sp.]
MSLTKEKRIWMYELLYISRKFEDLLGNLFANGKVAGWVHLGKGQEATGVALTACLNEKDYLVPYPRSRSSLLGKGLHPDVLLAEILGKKTGCCGGMGGEAHIMDIESKIYGTGGIIGSNIPIAVGLGYASLLNQQSQVVVCAFGDGATNRGAFHEAVNMAAVWNLPVVFVCENNLYAEFMPQQSQMKIKDIADRASSYGIEGMVVDGYNMEECYETFEKAINKAREGNGPTLIEVKTYRFSGHFEGDSMSYRDKEETAAWIKRDPFVTYKKFLLEEQIISEQEMAALEERVDKELSNAEKFALSSPFVTEEDVNRVIYG